MGNQKGTYTYEYVYIQSLFKNHAKFKLNLCYKEEMYARADTAKLK